MSTAGSISIEVTSVSVPSRGLGPDSGGSAPVWARVVTAASSEPWIETAQFSAAVGWRAADEEEAQEVNDIEERKKGQTNGGERASVKQSDPTVDKFQTGSTDAGKN